MFHETHWPRVRTPEPPAVARRAVTRDFLLTEFRYLEGIRDLGWYFQTRGIVGFPRSENACPLSLHIYQELERRYIEQKFAITTSPYQMVVRWVPQRQYLRFPLSDHLRLFLVRFDALQYPRLIDPEYRGSNKPLYRYR